MKIKTKLKNLYLKLDSLSNFLKIVLVFSLLLGISMCSVAGWEGYYETFPNETINSNISRSSVNITPVKLIGDKMIDLELPKNCSQYFVAGMITPFTPPIPFFWFRSWHFGQAPCNNFTIQTKPLALVKLKINDRKTNEGKIYEPEVSEGKYGYTKYTFSLKAKNIDSGIIIIEKDGEEIEVPFEYKYVKFWH